MFHYPISTAFLPVHSNVVDHRDKLSVAFNQCPGFLSRKPRQLSHSGEYTPSATNKWIRPQKTNKHITAVRHSYCKEKQKQNMTTRATHARTQSSVSRTNTHWDSVKRCVAPFLIKCPLSGPSLCSVWLVCVRQPDRSVSKPPPHPSVRPDRDTLMRTCWQNNWIAGWPELHEGGERPADALMISQSVLIICVLLDPGTYLQRFFHKQRFTPGALAVLLWLSVVDKLKRNYRQKQLVNWYTTMENHVWDKHFPNRGWPTDTRFPSKSLVKSCWSLLKFVVSPFQPTEQSFDPFLFTV